MASIKNLKKDINNTLGDLIDETIINTNDIDKSQEIIDEIIETFDGLIVRIHQKNIENKSVHYKAINADLETKVKAIAERINNL